MTDATPAVDQLLKNLDQTLLGDRHRLRRQLHELRKQTPVDEAKLAQWLQRFEASRAKVEARRLSVPPMRYDDALPIAAKRDEIKAAIAAHQVVVIAGETGSGKTTQLPKICLELGRGVHGLIGHTQPRRLAARSVATRVAEEIGTPLGELVGYQVRFEDQSNERSLIKLMTDGILLAETQHDRYLEKYDTIIVDEAHERSLNIDFLLGFLKTLLVRRPDLKLIITSATIAGITGVILSVKIGFFSTATGPGYLFPAIAAVFFGASQLSRRPNVWGTLLALYALALGIKGLQLVVGSGSFWVEPLFQGTTLIIAVSLASQQAVARIKKKKKTA